MDASSAQAPSDLAGDLVAIAAEVAAATGHRGRIELLTGSATPAAIARPALPTLSLLVGEAIRNAVRHAHPAGVAGTISVGCHAGPAGDVLVEIRDDGVGLPEGFDESRDGGAGFRLMRRAAARLGAVMTVRSSSLGLCLRLRLPASALESSEPNDGRTLPAQAAVLEALPAGVYRVDAAGHITYFNRAAAALWGRRPEPGQKWCGSWKLRHADGTPLAHEDCPMAAAVNEGCALQGIEAIVERMDGSQVPVVVFPTPLRDATGMVTGGVNIMIETSERNRVEQRRQLLTDELQHRAKNMFAITRAVVAQSLRDASLQDVRDVVLRRLQALGENYDRLSAAGWRGASLDDVVQSELSAFADRVEVEGPDMMLNPRAAQSFALAVHELATNAAKHGALSVASGRVAVTWWIAGEDAELHFRWIEQSGPPVTPPTQKGFGSVVLERVVAQDFGRGPQILFAPEGLTYELVAPLARITAATTAA